MILWSIFFTDWKFVFEGKNIPSERVMMIRKDYNSHVQEIHQNGPTNDNNQQRRFKVLNATRKQNTTLLFISTYKINWRGKMCTWCEYIVHQQKWVASGLYARSRKTLPHHTESFTDEMSNNNGHFIKWFARFWFIMNQECLGHLVIVDHNKTQVWKSWNSVFSDFTN